MRFLGFGLLCIIWGSTWVGIKMSLEGIPPLSGAGIRFLVSIAAIFLYVRLRKYSLRIDKRQFGILALSGFLIYSLDYGLIYWAEQHLSAGVTSIFFATYVLFTALATNFMFRQEKFYWRRFLGICLGFSGIIVVFFDQLILTRFKPVVILASLAVVAAAASAGISTVIVKKYLIQMNATVLTLYQLLLGTVVLVILGPVFEGFGQYQLGPRVLAAVLYLGIVGSAFAFVLFYWLLQRMSPISLSLIIYITPLVALAFDYMIFAEVISLRALTGMCIIFAGIWMTNRKRMRVNP
jgi:drug/metabolite transporter (DMT)-like permease